MVQRVQYMLVDDLDGTEAVETVSFSLDGVSYEIDLTAANAKKLRNDLAAWVGTLADPVAARAHASQGPWRAAARGPECGP